MQAPRVNRYRRSPNYKAKNAQAVMQPPMMQPLEFRRLLSMTPAIDFLSDSSSLPDASASTVLGYTPAQLQAVYGFSSISFNSGKTAANGAGQTIAIVDAYNDPTIAADLKTFDSKFGLATANLKVVNQTGGTSLPATDGGWAQEISLDVEWAHAIAPGANILLVETNSSSNSDLLAGVNYARGAAGVSVVSMSWGGSEFAGETSYDSDFTTPSGHTGVTFIAASGDNGSAGGVDWPASSPDVLSVGGTSLTVTSSGAYSSETGWSDSGGGVSQFEGEPEYQSGVQTLDARTVPDVSADANPSTGVAVYDSYSYDGHSGWMEFGGTSAAAPQWAGLISIADQGRVINKLGTLNGSTNTLPTLYDLEGNSSSYSADFHDITSGQTSYSVSAGSGYDLVTGIGSAKANKLVPALVSSTVNTTLTVTGPVYVPPVFPIHHRGFFLAGSEGATAVPTYAPAATSFTTTIDGVDPEVIQQSLFDSYTPQPISLIHASASAIDAGSARSGTINGAHSGIGLSATAQGISSLGSSLGQVMSPLEIVWDQGSSAVAHGPGASLEQDLLTAQAYAQEMISELGRTVAVDLAQAADSARASMAESLSISVNGMRNVIATGAVIIAGSYLLGEAAQRKNQKSPDRLGLASGRDWEPNASGLC
jgi:subtilase family serine protease